MESKHVRKILGTNIRRFRNELGYSQENLAAATGLNRSYIGSVERSENNVGIDNIDKIARGLNIPVDRLFVDPNHAKDSPVKISPHETGPIVPHTVIRTSQFKVLLKQCYQHTPRPDLIIVYLERCGVKFID